MRVRPAESIPQNQAQTDLLSRVYWLAGIAKLSRLRWKRQTRWGSPVGFSSPLYLENPHTTGAYRKGCVQSETPCLKPTLSVFNQRVIRCARYPARSELASSLFVSSTVCSLFGTRPYSP